MGAVNDGVDLAIRAIGHLVRDLGRVNCHFAFLGDGEAFEEVTRLARDLGLSEWVTFTGWADPPVVQEYLSAADIGLQPDPKNPRTDTAIAVKTLEYMAFRLPVVAFDLDQTRRTVGAAGVYAEPNDPLILRQGDRRAPRRSGAARGDGGGGEAADRGGPVVGPPGRRSTSTCCVDCWERTRAR